MLFSALLLLSSYVALFNQASCSLLSVEAQERAAENLKILLKALSPTISSSNLMGKQRSSKRESIQSYLNGPLFQPEGEQEMEPAKLSEQFKTIAFLNPYVREFIERFTAIRDNLEPSGELFWKKMFRDEIHKTIEAALAFNISFTRDKPLGYPVSAVDSMLFSPAEWRGMEGNQIMESFMANPNHIGCHTLKLSECAYKGTHEIERDVINIVAVDIFKAKFGSYDGYLSGGGTEANIQAIWMFRNFFRATFKASLNQIAILASEDTHYSISKAADLTVIQLIKVKVAEHDRQILQSDLQLRVKAALEQGIRYFIVICNVGTTMYGSIDDPNEFAQVLDTFDGLIYKIHIDASFGGFIYPFAGDLLNKITFENHLISSIVADGHKMLQTPYGSGIFICRKGLIKHVVSKDASYVEGLDMTLSGSRSGMVAVATWAILALHGPGGWKRKIKTITENTNFLCSELDALGIAYYRHPHMNIVAIKAGGISKSIAKKYHLVPKSYFENQPAYKIVVMGHVDREVLTAFIHDLREEVIQKRRAEKLRLLKRLAELLQTTLNLIN